MKELPQYVAVMYFIVFAWRSGITPQMAVVQNALLVINCSLQFNPSKRVFLCYNIPQNSCLSVD